MKAERVTALPIENHPSDSRVKLSADGKVQTLSERMGTGGGNTPLILEIREETDDRTENVGWVGYSADLDTEQCRGGTTNAR